MSTRSPHPPLSPSLPSSDVNGEQQQPQQQRRVSVQIGAMAQQQSMGVGGGVGSIIAATASAAAASAAVKGNFVVSQSDLWDTHTLNAAKQRQSPRNHPNQNRCQHGHMSAAQQQMQLALQQQQMNTSNSNLSMEVQTPSAYGSVNSSPSAGHMQRSVSEKNRSKHRHKANKMSVMCQSETDSEREQRDVGPVCGGGVNQTRKLAKTMQQHSHHHSSPNVAPMEKPHHRSGGGGGGVGGQHHYRSKVDSSTSSIYNACSESELLDGETAILPIFRKLLTEREPRYRSRNMVGASCPNISIKCDIVEYL